MIVMDAPSPGRCGSQLGGDNVCRKCESSGLRSPKRPAPALILALSIPGLLLPPFAVAAALLGARYRKRVERGTVPDSRVARLGFILGAAGVLVAIIETAALLYLLPVMLGPDISENEASAVAALRDICHAQSDHMRLTGSYAKNLELLRERGFLGLKNQAGYHFEMMVSRDAREFEVRAHPIEPGVTGVRHFYIDQSGVLRWSKSVDVGRTSPPVAERP